MKPSLSGIVPPIVTPLHSRDQLDAAGLERLIERLIAGGVGGLFLLGTTGEGPSLSYRLRRELIQRACAQVNKRLPVLVCITDTSFIESVNLGRWAADNGADMLVIAPPYYMPEGQPELLEYLEHLVPELPLPLFLYNMPAMTKVTLEPQTIRRAMDLPGIIGLKDSSGKMDYFKSVADLLSVRPDWSLLIGAEELLTEAVAAGGHGGVCGGANLFPKLYVKLFETARNGQSSRLSQLQTQVRRTGELLYRVGRHPSSLIKGIKCGLACMGVCDDFMAEPFHRFRAEERAMIKERVETLTMELQQLGLEEWNEGRME
jgi:4-hydroxy-tetrahydrodipicolinate synthase